MLSGDNYKQFTAEVHDDLLAVAKMLNILMLEKRQYDVPTEMAKQIIDHLSSGHWSKDCLYLVDHFQKALLALLPPNFLEPREVATMQVRQHTHGAATAESVGITEGVQQRNGGGECGAQERKSTKMEN